MKFYFSYSILLILLLVSCKEQKSQPPSEKPLSVESNRDTNKVTPAIDKNVANDEWKGSFYRNKKYHFSIQFPKGWEYDKGMSVNTLARAVDRQKGISLSMTIQHLPTEVPDDTDIFEAISIDDFKDMVNKLLVSTNKSSVSKSEVKKGALNNLPAYNLTTTYDLTSMDRTMTFVMRQVQCLKDSKYYNVQMVIPLTYYNDDTEQVFRSMVDSFKFEF
ncbi:MAG TPA: hypothetical protein VFG10_20145 [Saprospiraceae bacterium]|nr:hypothetical protein [Saprospiraceae bacterium]